MEILSPFARKVLDFIEPDCEKQKEWLKPADLMPPSQTDEMRAFCARIQQARQNHEKVLIAGDYDADGILSTSILVHALRSLDLETGFYIPDRIREGYGLHPSTVEQVAQKGYSLIITVDNGVKAHAALEKAAELGVDVIVTDHHTLEEEPQALTVVHPSRMEEPFAYLCGAGVAFECTRALGLKDERYLIWAAVASIADCMEMKAETRAIVYHGLMAFNETQEPHLACLCKERKYDEVNTAFQIIPKINSAGRLSNLANVNNLVRYFLNDSPEQITRFAAQLEQLNEQRKRLSEQVIGKAALLIRPARPVLLATDPSFHEGVVGLAAGNLCQKFHKPAIIGTLTPAGYKCSMRSPKGFHCMEFLNAFDGYAALGGHAQAAGFTILEENWESFQSFVLHHGMEIQWQPEEEKMMDIAPEECTVENIQSLDALRPFGNGFEMPKFCIEKPKFTSVFDLSQGKHRKFSLPGGLQALHFNQSSTDMAASALSVKKLIGTLTINQFQGKKQPNFMIDEIVYY